MSRFVDRSALETVPLGACACPGAPHEDGDWAKLRKELSGSEWAIVAQGDTDRSLALLIAEWNILDNDGDPVPVTESTIASLDLPTFRVIDAWIGEHVTPPKLPNVSAAPSPSSKRASGSPTRIPKKAA